MSTVIVANCGNDFINRLQINLYGPENIDQAIQLSRRGELVAVASSESLQSMLGKSKSSSQSSDPSQDLFEINKLSASLEQLKTRYAELQSRHVQFINNNVALMNKLLEHSRIIPSISSGTTESLRKIGNYQIGELVGEGTTGKIYACSKKDSPENLAVKVIDKQYVSTVKAVEAVEIEVGVMRKIQSPRVVSLVDVLHSEKYLHMIMERSHADLFEYLQYFPDGVPCATGKSIASQILEGLKVCHENGVTHRDIKPENILVNVEVDPKSGVHAVSAKLADFGTAAWDTDKRNINQGCVGSIGFLAPETAWQKPYDGSKVDIWGFGCIMIELLFGSTVFQKIWLECFGNVSSLKSPEEIQNATMNALNSLKKLVLAQQKDSSDIAINMMESCLQPNPALRLSASRLLQHAWFQSP